jgi:xanthine/uracil/vitamin C permease (AzgA family)
MEDVHLGGRFWLILLAIVIGSVFGCILLFLLVAGAWARWGAIGALIFFGLLMAGVSYVYDRTHMRKYED